MSSLPLSHKSLNMKLHIGVMKYLSNSRHVSVTPVMHDILIACVVQEIMFIQVIYDRFKYSPSVL